MKFRHSGDMGDIVYCLPVVQAMKGGDLYLDTSGGAKSKHVKETLKCFGYKRLRFGDQEYEFLKPLLDSQEYVKSVKKWKAGLKKAHDLDVWRARHNGMVNIAQSCLAEFGFPCNTVAPWLKVTVPKAIKAKVGKKIVVNRGLRYANHLFFWEQQRQTLERNAVFVGLPAEHAAFQDVFRVKIPHLKVKNALELAQIIGGCREFWGSQGLPMAIAIGLGVPFVQEVFEDCPNCRFQGRGNYVTR